MKHIMAFIPILMKLVEIGYVKGQDGGVRNEDDVIYYKCREVQSDCIGVFCCACTKN